MTELLMILFIVLLNKKIYILIAIPRRKHRSLIGLLKLLKCLNMVSDIIVMGHRPWPKSAVSPSDLGAQGAVLRAEQIRVPRLVNLGIP